MQSVAGCNSTDADELYLDWTMPGFDLENDVRLVFAPDGSLAASATLWDIRKPHIRLWSDGAVHPEHRGKGLFPPLMGWLTARAWRSVHKAPAGARVVLAHAVMAQDETRAAMVRRRGFEHVRSYYVMVTDLDRDIPELAWPDGLEIRPVARYQDERAVLLAFDEAFADHWGHVDSPIEERLAQWNHFFDNDPVFDPALWFVAWDGDQVAGSALCLATSSEDPAMGWVDVLGVRRPWRRKGLGLAFLHHAFREFKARGSLRAGLDVDAENLTGALRLYERAGMHVERQIDSYLIELRPGKDLTVKSIEQG
jgi:mycothiol synthase